MPGSVRLASGHNHERARWRACLAQGVFDDAFFASFEEWRGFLFKFIEEAPGGEKPQPFQKVFVHYTGYLLDGTKFDSSYDKGPPFSFRMNKGKVISGWEAVVGGMRTGMKVVVRIPPEFAYGPAGAGVIPANAPLVRADRTCRESSHSTWACAAASDGHLDGSVAVRCFTWSW